MYPQYWRRYRRHNRNPVNSFRRGLAHCDILGNARDTSRQGKLLTGFRLWRKYWRQFWGYIFGGRIFPVKIGPFAPFSARIQALSRARAFLLGRKYSRGEVSLILTFFERVAEVRNSPKFFENIKN
jgi:hypothetical protein